MPTPRFHLFFLLAWVDPRDLLFLLQAFSSRGKLVSFWLYLVVVVVVVVVVEKTMYQRSIEDDQLTEGAGSEGK